jgi:hypothetical protein
MYAFPVTRLRPNYPDIWFVGEIPWSGPSRLLEVAVGAASMRSRHHMSRSRRSTKCTCVALAT